jgi:hypothetical protein
MRTFSSFLRLGAALVLGLSVTVCGGGTTPSGSFLISAPTSLILQAGTNGTLYITITRSGGLDKAVSLTVEDAPVGLGHSFSPAVVPGDEDGSVLTLTVGAGVPAGSYTIKVCGNVTGMDERDIHIVLVVTAAPVGSFSLNLTPFQLTVVQGQTGTVNVTIGREAPFVGAVSLAFESPNAGISGAFDPASIPAAATQSTLTLTVGANLAPGTYTLTVRASAAGVPERSGPVELTVTEAPGFTLEVAAVGVQQGQVGAAQVVLARKGGFTGAVQLALENLVPGVTGILTPVVIPVGQTLGAIHLSVQASVPAGPGPFTLRGTAAGLPDVTLQVPFSVIAAPAGNVTVTSCDISDDPIWFAYQNGTEQWTQVAFRDGAYNFPITSATGGVAFVFAWDDGNSFSVIMILGTREELFELGRRWCEFNAPGKQLGGTVAGFGPDPNEWFTVTVGSSWVESHAAGTGYQLEDVPLGLQDLVAVKTHLIAGVPQGPSTMVIRRNTDYPPGSLIPVLDFGGPEAFATSYQTATVQNLATTFWEFNQFYHTGTRTTGAFPHFHPPTVTPNYMVVPAARAAPGDFYGLRVQARQVQGGPVMRTVTKTFTTPDPQTLTLGPGLEIPAVFEIQPAPLYQARIVTNLQPEYGNLWSGSYEQPTREGGFYVTAGYVGGTVLDLTTPDLRAVPGWNQAWGPLAGVPANMKAMAWGWTGIPILFPRYDGGVLAEPLVTLRSAALYKVMVP